MAAELKSPIEFRVLDGLAAREIDTEQIEWPADARVIFAMEGNEVVGRSSLVHLPVVEGTWVSQAKRGSTLAYRLLKKVEDVFRENGKPVAMAMAHDTQPEIADFLERFGFTRVPVTLYVKTLVKE